MTTTMIEVKDWLTSKGFKFQVSPFVNTGNEISWIAYRRISYDVRPCETNDTKRLQVVIHPYQAMINDDLYSRVEVEVTGEYKKIWYQIRAYSLSTDELIEQFDMVESSLMRAWNSLAE